MDIKTHIYAAYKRLSSDLKKKQATKLRGWVTKDCLCKWKEKEKCDSNHTDNNCLIIIIISDKIDFKTRATMKEKEGHYIMTRD